MRLSALDIKKQEFKKSFKGYDINEVEAYLDTVANEVENLYRENENLKQKIEELEQINLEIKQEIQIYRDNEKTFQKAIVKSQDMSEEVLANAKNRADLILKEAEFLSNKTKHQVQEEIFTFKQELEELRNRNENLIEEIRNFLADKLNSIEEYSKNMKLYRIETNISSMQNEPPDEPNSDYNLDLNIDESK